MKDSKINMTIIDKIKRAIPQLFFISYSITVLLFMAILIITPFRSMRDVARGILTIPNSFTFINFINIWKGGFGLGFKNSMIFSISTCIITLIVGGLAGYAFSFLKFKLNRALYTFVFSCMFISIMLISIPLFMQYKNLGLINSFLGVLIIYASIRLPFTVFIFKNFFDEFPRPIIEAAKIDGINDIGILTRIIIPLSKPVAITVILFNFIAIWTDFLIGLLFLQKNENVIVMLRVISIFQGGISRTAPLSTGYAGLFLVTMPAIILYILGKKYYIEGLTLGSIK